MATPKPVLWPHLNLSFVKHTFSLAVLDLVYTWHTHTATPHTPHGVGPLVYTVCATHVRNSLVYKVQPLLARQHLRCCSTQPYQSSECAGTIHVRLFSLAADNGVQVYTADHTSQMLTGFAAGSRWATVCASSPKCTLRCAAGCTPGAQLQHAAL